MSDPFDIQDDPATENDSMKRLVAMAEEAVATEKLVLELEDNLSTIKKTLNQLKTVALPDAMAECGIADAIVNHASWQLRDSPCRTGAHETRNQYN